MDEKEAEARALMGIIFLVSHAAGGNVNSRMQQVLLVHINL